MQLQPLPPVYVGAVELLLAAGFATVPSEGEGEAAGAAGSDGELVYFGTSYGGGVGAEAMMARSTLGQVQQAAAQLLAELLLA